MNSTWFVPGDLVRIKTPLVERHGFKLSKKGAGPTGIVVDSLEETSGFYMIEVAFPEEVVWISDIQLEKVS